MYFDKSCLKYNITQNYAHINIKTAETSEAAKHIEMQARNLQV
jgi:hypothetical protein